MATNIEIIVGTYEQFLLGYKVEQDGENHSLHQSFAVHAHIAAIRSVHSSKRYLASGGADDRTYIYDMKTRQEIQMLTTHNSAVNHVRFTPDATHLLSASEDGSVAAIRTGSWIPEGLWKTPHNGKSVNHVSIHPSGKLALTLGADLTLKTWNLIKGRQIFTTNLKTKSSLGAAIELVEFCPNGDHFVLSGTKAVEVWSVASAGVVRTIECESKPTCVCWLDGTSFLIGLNNGQLIWADLDLDEKEEPLKFEMYKSRVKGLYYQNDHLASISSDGNVTVWSLNVAEQDITELCSTNIGCRPVCLTMIDLGDFADDYILKREADEEEVDDKKDVNGGKKVAAAPKNLGKVVIENDDDVVAPKQTRNSKSKKPKAGTRKSARETPKKPAKAETVEVVEPTPKKTPREAIDSAETVKPTPKKTPKKSATSPESVKPPPKKTPKKSAMSPESVKPTPKKTPKKAVTSPELVKPTPKKTSKKSATSPESVKPTPKKTPKKAVTSPELIEPTPKKTPKKSATSPEPVKPTPKKTPRKPAEPVEAVVAQPVPSKKRKSLAATPASAKKAKSKARQSINKSGFLEEDND